MGGNQTVAAVFALAILASARLSLADPKDPCSAQLPPAIRISDCSIARSLEDGLARSTSFKRLVERIGDLKGIVFVTLLDRARNKSVTGGLSHRVTQAGESCILQIGLVRNDAYGDRTIATLAHEFRHAIEVLEHPDARSEAGVNRLYERIGYSRAAGAMETDAALEMGRLVAEELKRNKKGR